MPLTYTITLNNYEAEAAPGLALTDTATITVTTTPVNDPPTLHSLADLEIDEDAPTQTVALNGITSGDPDETQTLTVTASSSYPALIPDPSVAYTSPNQTGSLRFTPAPDGFDEAAVLVTVSDGLAETHRVFQVLVNPVNDPPTLDSIPDVEIYANPATAALKSCSFGCVSVTIRSHDRW